MITLKHNNISPQQYLWRNDPSVYAWTRQNGTITLSDHGKWLESLGQDKSKMMFGIFADYQNVGTAGLTSIRPEHGSAEFSLLIGPEHQKKGYGKEALIRLLQYAFHHLRLNCIWGETFVGNPAYKMFQYLGFQTDGLLRQRYFKNGHYADAYAVSILLEEAKKQPWFNA